MHGVDLKPRPNHARYVQIMRRMTPEQRAAKVFELSDMMRSMFWQALRESRPHMPEAQRHELGLKLLERCHNSNY
ncbi:MAG: hypothetical protein WD042_08030 [Phycisphaeraceae bacterium]